MTNPRLTGVVQVAGGSAHSLALKSDGTVWAWGYNVNGQLGDANNGTSRNTPVQVLNLAGVVQIASGGIRHSLALKSDGTVWAWGWNIFGQLGDGTNTDRNVPAQVSGLTDMVQIAGGQYHSLAVKSDGTVWSWGRNLDGQLGDGTDTNSNVPVQALGLTGVVQSASCGFGHSLALKSDGTVWAWGANSQGQVGDGTTAQRSTPVQVLGLVGMTHIAGGSFHSLAVQADTDAVAPVITLNGSNPMSVSQGSVFTDPGATATDNVDGSVAVTASGSVNTAVPGTYILTYTATDVAGNSTSTDRTVNVVDATAPVITLNGSNPMSVSQGSVFTDPGATATDNVDGSVAVTASGSVNTAVPGTYILTYTATDVAGNSTSTDRTVNVVDATAPVITLNGSNSMSVSQDSVFTDPGATAMDNVDGSVAVTVSGSVNTAVPGTYTLTYSATDVAGNSSSTTRTVIVTAVTTSGSKIVISVKSIWRGRRRVHVKIEVKNSGNVVEKNVTITSATLIGVSARNAVPKNLGNIKPAHVKEVDLRFKGLTPATQGLLVINGTSSLGSFSTTLTVTTP